ncbi:hypothetical protein ABPG75_005269 [Micractinium tetrahymenae]
MAAGQPGGGSTALRELLLGHGPGQLHLSAVRARAEELKRSLEAIIQQLQFAADRLQWSDTLDRFTVINVQYQHLQDALRPLLRQFAAYPRSVNQSNAPILPIMLATKLLPEMEAEERALLSALAAEQQQVPAGGGSGGADVPQLSLAEQFAWIQDQERELNHLIDALVREEEGLLGAKGARRRELAAAVAKAAAAPPPAAPGRPAAAPAGARPGQQQQPAPDPLLAAVAFGAGLI